MIVELVKQRDIQDIWELLKDLTPIKESSSLHIVEKVYKLNDVEFHAFWAIGINDELPESILFDQKENK